MKVSVIGAGQMGNGIAHVFAQSGHPVSVIDIAQDRLDKALATISKNLDRQVMKGTLSEDQKKAALANISTATDMATGVKNAELVVEAATENPDKRILVDLAAQTHDPLVKWMDDSGVLETAEELGLSFNYWHVMDSGKDSVDLLKKLLDRFGARLNYVLVLNQLRGETFDILDKSGEKERALALNARLIALKRLHEPVINKIDAGSTSFWAAKNKSETDITARIATPTKSSDKVKALERRFLS